MTTSNIRSKGIYRTELVRVGVDVGGGGRGGKPLCGEENGKMGKYLLFVNCPKGEGK
jgi:hypothetical protein